MKSLCCSPFVVRIFTNDRALKINLQLLIAIKALPLIPATYVMAIIAMVNNITDEYLQYVILNQLDRNLV